MTHETPASASNGWVGRPTSPRQTATPGTSVLSRETVTFEERVIDFRVLDTVPADIDSLPDAGDTSTPVRRLPFANLPTAAAMRSDACKQSLPPQIPGGFDLVQVDAAQSFNGDIN